jgi:hypothetical protein
MPAISLMQDGTCGTQGAVTAGSATVGTVALSSHDTPNGNALNLQGAIRGLLFVTVDDEEDENPTVGTLTFEESHDDGVSWYATTAVSRIDAADASDYISTLGVGTLPAILKVDPLTGPATLRARVSAAFDAPVSVYGVAVGR